MHKSKLKTRNATTILLTIRIMTSSLFIDLYHDFEFSCVVSLAPNTN